MVYFLSWDFSVACSQERGNNRKFSRYFTNKFKGKSPLHTSWKNKGSVIMNPSVLKLSTT